MSQSNQPAAYWHTLPLHYVPLLLVTRSLFSQKRLAAAGLPVRPRPSATRRDRKLHLAGFVHLSLAAVTPLLRDKIRSGYPHALIEFTPDVADLSGAAFIPYNTKAWRHRDDFAPVTDPVAKARFLAEWSGGRYRSAELLVPEALPLAPHARVLHLASEPEARWLRDLTASLDIVVSVQTRVSPDLFPGASASPDLAAHDAYSRACRDEGHLLPPPDLPFD